MPYPYRIRVEYTKTDGQRETTYAVDGSHRFILNNAKEPNHRNVIVECSGPTGGDSISDILFKLTP